MPTIVTRNVTETVSHDYLVGDVVQCARSGELLVVEDVAWSVSQDAPVYKFDDGTEVLVSVVDESGKYVPAPKTVDVMYSVFIPGVADDKEARQKIKAAIEKAVFKLERTVATVSYTTNTHTL